MTANSKTVRIIPIICGAVPILVALAAYWISIHYGNTPSCIVVWEGCVSISAAGRQPPAVFLFKGALLPTATLIALYWWLCGSWLHALGEGAATIKAIRILGIVGALFLMLYITYLGSSGDVYRLMRRYGVTVYFASTLLTQILLARSMLYVAADRVAALAFPARAKLGCCALMLLLGLTITLLKPFLDDPGRLENSVEWIFALLMQINFLLTYPAWRATHVTTGLFAGSSPSDRKQHDSDHDPGD